MTTAFFFDTVMEEYNGDFYTVTLTNQLWQKRYLPELKDMIVATRVKHVQNLSSENLSKSNGSNVKMMPIESYRNIPDLFKKKQQIRAEIVNVLEKSENIIVRIPSPLGSYVCSVCKELNREYTVEMVADPWFGYYYYGKWQGKLLAPIMKKVTKKSCREASNVIYVTKEYLQKRYPTKGNSYGISDVVLDDFSANENVLSRRLDKIESGSKKYVIGLVGNLNLKFKGHKVAIDALKRVLKNNNDVELQFIGGGNPNVLKEYCRNLGLEKNVVFKGILKSGTQVLDWMDMLDILCIPSFQEGLPRVVVEAMSRACPVVGARTGGIPELIGSKYIHEPGDSKKLAIDIVNILEDKKLRKEIAEINYKKSFEFNDRKITNERLSILKQIIEDKNERIK